MVFEDALEIISAIKRSWRFQLEQIIKKRNKAGLKLLLHGTLGAFMTKIEGYDQKRLLTEYNWDVLIVLDACRYDYFEQEYREFFYGKLLKTVSPASGTVPWLKTVFSGFYPNIHIISSNPFINSKGIKIMGYKATDHFLSENIYDVWDYKWDENLNTVHPKDVMDEALCRQNEIQPPEKLVIWFLQPHGPWIGEPKILTSSSRPMEGHDEAVVSLIRKGEISIETFREAYRGNLRLVLKFVSGLVNQIDKKKKIIITSDHGELLGEYNSFLHFSFFCVPELRQVPFLIVER